MYVLEIETKNKLIKVKNLRKARFVDRIFCEFFQVLDNYGKWNTICRCSVGINLQRIIVEKVNFAIRSGKKSIYLGNYI